MRRAIGPIVTTGVAIVVAGVVVANPIVAPRADVQIPAVKLSGSSDATGSMLDQAFLDAIAPRPADSTNPFSVLKQLITSLAADAGYLGKNAIVNAFVAGVAAVSEPELTAASFPFAFERAPGAVSAAVAPPPDFAGLAALAQTAGLDPAAIVNGALNGAANLSSALDPTHVTTAIGTAVDELASSVVSDAGYVGHELIAAAYAAGAVVATEPAMIVATLQSLVKGDIKGALQTAVAAATAPLRPTGMIINAFVSVVQSHLAELTTGVPTITVPTPVQAANPLASLAAADSTPAVAGDRGVRAGVGALADNSPVESVVSETPSATPATTAITATPSVDVSTVARGLAGLGAQVLGTQARTPAAAASEAANTDTVATTPAAVSAPRAVARDAAKQSRDGARSAAGRGVRGSTPAN